MALLASMLAGASCRIDIDPGDLETLDRQPTERFVAGATFYLPMPAEGRWVLAGAPPDNENAVVPGADGYARFTPVVEGEYELVIEGTDERRTLTVVPSDARPFYNLNYYPAHSAEPVGDELWVANVQRPTLSRVDPDTLEVLGEIQVGPWPVSIAWREGMDVAVVAQRGNDTLGLVERDRGRLIDAIWVGDEPAMVVLGPEGKTAYVALKGENAVAVVDLERRERSARIEVGSDPLAMAISEDGGTLWVASHRSGHPSRAPFEDDPVEQERDLAVIDTEAGEVVDWWTDIGTTITGLRLREDRDELYVTRLRNDTAASLGDPEQPNYMHEIAVFDATSGQPLRAADLGRQASSAGFAVSLHEMALAEDRLWIVAEGSDLALALDADSLAELGRVPVPGRPRSIVAGAGGQVFAHGAQGTALTRIAGLDPAAAQTVQVTADNRPAEVADGQYYFTGAGRGYAENWSCNSCHVDGLSDTLIWNAGPFSGEKVSRPFFWLEGTYPLGWDGYLSSVDNYAFTVNTNVGVRPNTAEHRALSAYLSSMMPPPAANGFSRRDGGLSELGAQGKEIYEGKAGCASCHALPLTTSRAVLAQGVTEGTTDIPGLIGTYRLGVWLKRGEATRLHEATDEVFASFGDPQLSEDEREALDRFMLELTARDFFVLSTEPRAGTETLAVDEPVSVVWSHPVFDDPANLALVTLRDPAGVEVELERTVSADGRHLSVVPTAPLAFDTAYELVVDPAFESFDEQRLWTADPDDPQPWRVALRTAAAPALRVEGDYLWTIDMPTADIEAGRFDLDNTIATSVSMSVASTEAGGEVVLDYGQDLVLERGFVVDADALVTPPLPIPIGPSFADSTGMQATFVDLDGDGVGDFAEGTLTISGPGFVESGVAWRLSRPTVAGECDEGSDGDLPVTVDFDDQGLPIVDWGSGEADGLGVYFIGPDAQPPTGPGQPVTGGEVYWVVQLASFPNGFPGPVGYGVVPEGGQDDTAAVGGGEGPAALTPGTCVKAAVTTTGFQSGSVVFVVP